MKVVKFALLSALLAAFVFRCHASDVVITTTRVPNGTNQTSYFAVISAKGGCTPYKWAVVAGKLPSGVRAQESSKTTALDLIGKPTVAASYSFKVAVTGCRGPVSEESYKIVIKPETHHVVDLRWDASSSKDVAGYNVYRGPDGVKWKKINVSLIASTFYDDSTVADGSTYYYAATAVNIKREESRKTRAIKVSIPE